MGRETVNILVVDDDRHVRSALKRFFVNHGWAVETASCGRDALDVLAAGTSFDVVVADYFMPNINGVDFLKRVNARYPEIFCVMLTAYPNCDSIRHSMRTCLRSVLLQKPWDESLLTLIENSLQDKQLQAKPSVS